MINQTTEVSPRISVIQLWFNTLLMQKHTETTGEMNSSHDLLYDLDSWLLEHEGSSEELDSPRASHTNSPLIKPRT